MRKPKNPFLNLRFEINFLIFYTVTSKSYNKPGCNIEEIMDVVREIVERENDIDILKFATEVFLKMSHREMFLTIKKS